MPNTVPTNALTSLLLLIFFCASFEVYAMRHKDTPPLWGKLLTGAWIGVISIVLMHFKMQYGTVAFDFKTVVLCLSGLFFGHATTAMATCFTIESIIFHSENPSGSEIIAECTYTVAAGAIGIMLHESNRKGNSKKSLAVLALAIIIMQAITWLCIHVCGSGAARGDSKDLAMVILLVQPATIMLIGTMMNARIKHFNTEHKLKILEDKYNKLILCNDDIFWEIDAAGKVTYVSDNVTQALGYTPEELIGRMPYYFIEDVPSVRLIAEYGKVSDQPGKDYFRHTLVLKHKGGNRVYCDTRGMSIIDPDIQKTSGFVCVTRNVTNSHLHNELSKHNQKFIREQTSSLQKLQNEIEDYKQRLERAKQETEDVRSQSSKAASKKMNAIANICNEIAPAMDDIQKYIAILNDKKSDPNIKDTALQQLLHTSDFLSSLSKDIMDSDALANGIIKVSLSIENIEKTINEICDYYNSRNLYLLKKPIIMQREIDLRPDQKNIKTDIQHIKRILNILIANAYIFTNTGQVTVKCTLQSEDELLFSVSDTGIGVPEAAYKNMFRKFDEYDLPTNVKRNVAKHSGLGLSICKALVELMGGQIWFVSEIGKGTTISFTTPYIKAGEMASETNAQYNWQGHTALVATQKRFNAILISEILAKTNIRYRSINVGDHDVQQESDYFKQYDVIITDEETSGTAALNAITQRHPAAAVITIGHPASANTICKEIDQHFTQKT